MTKEQKREYRATHKEQIAKYSKKYYESHGKRNKKIWNENHKEDMVLKKIEYAKNYYQNHKEQCLIYATKYQTENKEKLSEYYKLRSLKLTNHVVYILEINGFLYVGSTNNFNKRIANHKKDCVLYPNSILYCHINTFGGWEKVVYYTVAENIKNKKERLIIEQCWIEELAQSKLLNQQKATNDKI